MEPVRIVCATRKSPELFSKESALSRSLEFIVPSGEIQLSVYPENTLGLPQIYNTEIRKAKDNPVILVFAHDDIFLTDFFCIERLRAALVSFDLVGVVGCRERIPYQPTWCYVDTQWTPASSGILSGAIASGHGFPSGTQSVLGPHSAEVKLLDGVFLACRSQVLIEHEIYFDERFDFHFYDMDFCRQFEAADLRMGTAPISIVHESVQNYGSQPWLSSYRDYLTKWGG